MIFVTIGEQLPFDRLIAAIDKWAAVLGKEVFAQIGRTEFRPSYIAYKHFLDPEEFKERFESAELIIGHAGMGTIITALELQKPLLVMPRKASLNEHRTDHQFATARRFQAYGIIIAFDEFELAEKLSALDGRITQGKSNESLSKNNLHNVIRNFVFNSNFYF